METRSPKKKQSINHDLQRQPSHGCGVASKSHHLVGRDPPTNFSAHASTQRSPEHSHAQILEILHDGSHITKPHTSATTPESQHDACKILKLHARRSDLISLFFWFPCVVHVSFFLPFSISLVLCFPSSSHQNCFLNSFVFCTCFVHLFFFMTDLPRHCCSSSLLPSPTHTEKRERHLQQEREKTRNVAPHLLGHPWNPTLLVPTIFGVQPFAAPLSLIPILSTRLALHC